ncbi:MAG: TonB-dependent receptor plug domain-containing protein, partial [Verrucomicrobiae bacterium]|nr:TonB-dependent receptor plug domain-containing protein [Verrucomicrobiae bacterium]
MYNYKSKWLRLGTALCFGASLGLIAQDSEDDENVYEISPFQVDGSGDDGYLAGSTLAGTRLNSSLSDVAAAISPFTKEFINDIGADSIEQLLEYSNNSVRMDNTELANDNQVIEFEFQFNVRGLPASRSRNYFVWDVISMDNFNIERVDESRGPNSILFGVGSAGGVVNTSTKQARFSEINELQFMFGSNSQLRGSLDFNRVLIEDKLAIRFNAVWDEEDSWRRFEFKDQERYHFATTWKATDTTVVRGEIEWGEVIDNLGRSYLGDDFVSQWIDAGMPDRSESTANNARRQNAWIHVDNDDGLFFTGTGGTWYTNLAGTVVELVSDETTVMKEGLLDWEANPGGPDNIRDTDYTVWTVFL